MSQRGDILSRPRAGAARHRRYARGALHGGEPRAGPALAPGRRMQLELVPLVLAGLVGLVGLALLADAWLADAPLRATERRRHARAERHRAGEAAIGVGFLSAAAALAGRDTWRFATAAVIAAAVLVIAGALLNARFLRERLTSRGPARRGREGDRRGVGFTAPRGAPDRRPHDRRLAERRQGLGPEAGPPAA